MEIKVFGSGCARCNETEKLVKNVIAEKGISAEVTKITDLKQMMEAGIMLTPAVVIDGIVKSAGKVPSKDEIAGWFDGVS